MLVLSLSLSANPSAVLGERDANRLKERVSCMNWAVHFGSNFWGGELHGGERVSKVMKEN